MGISSSLCGYHHCLSNPSQNVQERHRILRVQFLRLELQAPAVDVEIEIVVHRH